MNTYPEGSEQHPSRFLDQLYRSEGLKRNLADAERRGFRRGLAYGFVAAGLIFVGVFGITAQAEAARLEPDPAVDVEGFREFGRTLDRLFAFIGAAPEVDLGLNEVRVRLCESGHDYGAVSPSGTYRGAWQFDAPTWAGAVTRAGFAHWSDQDPASAPAHVQDHGMRQLFSERGAQPWPVCGRWF